MKHVRLPVEVEPRHGYWEVYQEPEWLGMVRVHIDKRLSVESAREIERVINAHDALVGVCEDVIRSYERNENIPISGVYAALALAKGE